MVRSERVALVGCGKVARACGCVEIVGWNNALGAVVPDP